MEDLKNVYISPLPDSPYVKPFRFNYTQNGKEKTWDLLEVHDSVAIIVFNVTRKVMVFVKQFRPAIYYNCIDPKDRNRNGIDTKKYPASLGIALEMCAGIIDKNKAIDEIAREEVLEECGYNVQLNDLQKIISYRSGVGVQGSLQTLYYCEVTDDMKTEQGGGVDDEIIEVIEKTIPEIEEMVNSRGPLASPPSCLFALMWFLHHKADQYRNMKEEVKDELDDPLCEDVTKETYEDERMERMSTTNHSNGDHPGSEQSKDDTDDEEYRPEENENIRVTYTHNVKNARPPNTVPCEPKIKIRNYNSLKRKLSISPTRPTVTNVGNTAQCRETENNDIQGL